MAQLGPVTPGELQWLAAALLGEPNKDTSLLEQPPPPYLQPPLQQPPLQQTASNDPDKRCPQREQTLGQKRPLWKLHAYPPGAAAPMPPPQRQRQQERQQEGRGEPRSMPLSAQQAAGEVVNPPEEDGSLGLGPNSPQAAQAAPTVLSASSGGSSATPPSSRTAPSPGTLGPCQLGGLSALAAVAAEHWIEEGGGKGQGPGRAEGGEAETEGPGRAGAASHPPFLSWVERRERCLASKGARYASSGSSKPTCAPRFYLVDSRGQEYLAVESEDVGGAHYRYTSCSPFPALSCRNKQDVMAWLQKVLQSSKRHTGLSSAELGPPPPEEGQPMFVAFRHERYKLQDKRCGIRWYLIDTTAREHLAILGEEKNSRDAHYQYTTVREFSGVRPLQCSSQREVERWLDAMVSRTHPEPSQAGLPSRIA